jgi:hypothetical protein
VIPVRYELILYDHATPLYMQKLALTSPRSGGRSVAIVRLRTKVTELVSYAHESRPPLWSSGQSSWLQIQRSLFDFRSYQIF